ncbi:gas vesicle protein [Streptomyces sp. NPDC052309]|uniref:Gas vesicle protein n=1 Tax=Streptomyces griseicoloratus TaxID=2752516 RepID=A0A926KZR0_9ACTN|nr:gas vesicle protein [Streptomyces griseicoloratus]MBD0418709.1 gas vesicle protein [Streptomyces griseicoloratus]
MSNEPTANRGNKSTKNTRNNNSNTGNEDNGNTDNSTADHRPSPMEVLRQARAQFAELTGTAAESVSSFEQTEDGWSLEVEVLELERVPDTMSLMASYQVELDAQGQLTGYRRVQRYERGRADARRPGGR